MTAASPPLGHLPVLLDEVLEHLAVRPDGIYVDGTFGGGGYSRSILRRLGEKGRLIAIDLDAGVFQQLAEEVRGNASFVPVVGSYGDIRQIIQQLGIERIDGMVVDLGLSSLQLDDPARGFSFRFDGPLDMRFNQSTGLTAAEILNTYSEDALTEVFRSYGEEPRSRQIARLIAKVRAAMPFSSTQQLRAVVESVVPEYQQTKVLARVFQALRIVVNGELNTLTRLLDEFPTILAPGGRLLAVSFHSLEDRLVKQAFRRNSERLAVGAEALRRRTFPGLGREVARRGIEPSENEVQSNPRARSARLRVFEVQHETA